ARALVAQPKLLLADEPTGALDSATSRDVMKVLQAVQDDGVSVVIITHERDIAHMTDRLIHLVDGLITSDTPQLRLDPDQIDIETGKVIVTPALPAIPAQGVPAGLSAGTAAGSGAG
ncbi:MAG: hypothetical protein ABIV06_04865, partial [Thermoanaerobaculia bacterium]